MSLPTEQKSEVVSAFAVYKKVNVSKSGENVPAESRKDVAESGKDVAESRKDVPAESRKDVPAESRKDGPAKSREHVPAESREDCLTESKMDISAESREISAAESNVNTSASVKSTGDASVTQADNAETTLNKPKQSTLIKSKVTGELGTDRKRKRLRKKNSQKKKRKKNSTVKIVHPQVACISSEDCDIGPFFEKFNSVDYESSRAAAVDLFSMLINPLGVDLFFKNLWEKKAVWWQRHKSQYNNGWFSTKELDTILSENFLEFSTNIDLTTYEGGVRNTHSPTGRATAASVWEHFKNGCSVRLLNPQSYSKGIRRLNSTLQEMFGSCMGANVYLTPAGSQGFAPHYDDIEAFVMQLEGRKKWKLYHPRNEQERLPRFSSPNFTEKDLSDPILEVILEPGDLLYFPRGTIHQAATLPEEHSLHVTISTFQKNSWADLFEKLLPAALDIAVAENPEFRSGLPIDYLQYTGIAHSDSSDPQRIDFCKKMTDLFSKLAHYAPVDAASDQMGAEFIHGSLPPCTTERESRCSVIGGGDHWGTGGLVEGKNLTKNTRVKLIRHGAIRLVMEKDGVVMYSSVQNSTLNPLRERSSISIDDNEAVAIEYLIHSYPDFVAIDSILLEGNCTLDKVDLCCNLYLQGLLMIEPA